jgi:hypothetical protein
MPFVVEHKWSFEERDALKREQLNDFCFIFVYFNYSIIKSVKLFAEKILFVRFSFKFFSTHHSILFATQILFETIKSWLPLFHYHCFSKIH